MVAYPTVMPGERPITLKRSRPCLADACGWSPIVAKLAPWHCPEPVAWRGLWRAPSGRRYRVAACEGHPTSTDRGQRHPGLASRRVVPAGA